MTTRRTQASATKEADVQEAVAAKQSIGRTEASASDSVPASSPWLAPMLCLRSSSFGVAGSVAAKIGLTDDWTEGVVQRIQQAAGAAMAVVGSNSSSSGESKTDPVTDENAAWRHTLLFYFVRVSFVLLKLYLDGRMLQLFVAAMHASNSLLASTYNQCCAVVLAVSYESTSEIGDGKGDVGSALSVLSDFCFRLSCCIQGVCGFVLFSEPVSPTWLLGAALILAGVVCVQWGNSDAEDDETGKAD